MDGPKDSSSDQDVEENTSLNSELIQRLRDLMPLKTNIDFKNCDDSFLRAVLQSRRFNLDSSFELLCDYFEFREKYSEFFDDLKASELRYALEDGFPCVLPNTDSNGSKIMVLFPGTWDIETFGIETLLKATIFSLENLSKREKVREKGIVMLVDFSGWSSSHAAKLTIAYLRKTVAVFQECSTVWFKNIHVINQPWYINVFMALTKPFMKDNVHARIVLHGNNLSTLHQFIQQDALPAEFGGNNPEVDQCYWANILLQEEKKMFKRTSTIRLGKNPFGLSFDEESEKLCDSNEKESLLSK